MLCIEHCLGYIPQYAELFIPLEVSFIPSKANRKIPITAPPGTTRKINLLAVKGQSGYASSRMWWPKQRLLNYSDKGCSTMARTTVMWKTVQLPPSAIWLTFVLPAPRMEGAVGVSSKHHDFPLLGNLPAHRCALGFPQWLVWSPAEVKDLVGSSTLPGWSRGSLPWLTSLGSTRVCMVPVPHVPWRGQCCAVGRNPSICPMARHTSTALSRSTTQWYRQRLGAVPPTSSSQITTWLRQLESTCNFPVGTCNSQCQEATRNLW